MSSSIAPVDSLSGGVSEVHSIQGQISEEVHSLRGWITKDLIDSLSGTISEVSSLVGIISDDVPSIKGCITIVGGVQDNYNTYTGSCTVTPKTNQQVVLNTKYKKVNDNITVEKIPYYEVSNNDGGVTVIIG